jgi:L-2-hydroxyglutarate oxidase
MYDFAIVGGGIVGLSTCMILGKAYPQAKIVVFEKEADWAPHQTGHNSGVIHSGIYYKPGSLKANLAREGNRLLVEFCQKHSIPHDVCGKVIVATTPQELPGLEKLYQRGLENGLPVKKKSAAEIQDIEPHVSCLAGIYVPTTGIVDFAQVCHQYAAVAKQQGADLRLNTLVQKITKTAKGQIVNTNQGSFKVRYLVNCAGLYSDRLAQLEGLDPKVKIIPFRGEYYELKPEKRYLVKNLIYPVPNPAFPFLGVHFTRMIDGSIHAGPNAVLSFKREGYRKTDFDLRDLSEVLTYPGFWKLAAKHADEGIKEMIRSVSKAAFVRSLQMLIPEVQADDVIPAGAGVRAQALRPDGNLVDDFLILEGQHSLHVCNAPSPAATSSLAIANAIVEKIAARDSVLMAT